MDDYDFSDYSYYDSPDYYGEDFTNYIDYGGGTDVPVSFDVDSDVLQNLDLAGTDVEVPNQNEIIDLGSFEDLALANQQGVFAAPSEAEGQLPLPEGSGYYDEETGHFIYDPNGPLRTPNLAADEAANLERMSGYKYDSKTGQWTTPGGQTYRPSAPPSYQTRTGQQIMNRAGALPSGQSKSGIPNLLSKLLDPNKKDSLMSLLPLLLAMMAMNKQQPSGATIPSLSASRSALPYTPPRAGEKNISYFSPVTYRAAGGIAGLNSEYNLGSYSDGGRLLKGPGDGVSDDIPATIGGKQPARLADGEFVVPARIVSELGNGSTDAGARKLYEMMKRVEQTRKKGKHIAQDTKADKHLPA